MAWTDIFDPTRVGTRLKEYVGTPEDQADATQMLTHGLYGLPIGAASHVIPPVAAGAPASDVKNWVPGVGSYIGGFGLNIAEWLANAAAKSGEAELNTPTPFNLTPDKVTVPYTTLPGHETLDKMNTDAVAAAKSILPKYEATTEAAKTGEEIGIGIGQGAAFVAPEALLTKLPSTVAAATRLLVPPVKTAPIGAIAGGGAAALASGDAAAAEQPSPTVPLPTPTLPHIDTLPTPVLPPIDDKLHPGGRITDETDWTYPQYAAGLAVGGALLWGAAKHGPHVLNYAADVLRGTMRSVPEANAALYTAVPRGVTPKPVEMPLPGNASGMTRQWAESAYNPNAVLNEVAKGTYGTGTPAADAAIAANEAVNNPANASRRMESLFRTGVEEGTGHTFPRMAEYKEAVNGLTPGQQENFSWGAWYKNELNIRSQNIEAAAKQGTMWTPQNDKEFRVNFNDTPTDQMRTAVQTIEGDAQVKALLDQNKSIQMAIVDSAEKRGLITKSQAEYSRKHYPDFMPTIDAQGNYLHSWDGKIREPNTGVNTPAVPAWEAMTQHFDRSIRGAQLNDWRRGWILNQHAIQKANPGSAEIVTERLVGAKPVSSTIDRGITIQTSEGPRTFDVNNSAVLRGLKGGPPVMDTTRGIVSGARRLYTNMTTGPLAMISGHPFALKNFIRDSQLIPAQASPGAWRGYFDQALDRRLPYDPTFPIGAGTTALKDSASVTTRLFADIFASKTNAVSQTLRSMIGDAKVDSLVNWMRAEFEKSNLAARHAQGVGAGGNRSTVDSTNLIIDKSGTFRDPTAHTIAPMIGKQDFSLLGKRIPLPKAARAAVESYLNLSTLAHDLYGVISDAPHSFYHDINVSNPRFTPRTLFNEVQGVTGNPGTQGTGALTLKSSRSMPYYNTSVQGLGRSLAAFRDHPLHVTSTMLTTLLFASAAEQLSALVSGPEHVDHLENQTSNSQKARNAIIYHGPSTDPNEHTEIPIAIEHQPLKPFISALFGHAVGTWTAHQDEDVASRLIHTLSSLFHDHVSTDVQKQQVIGAINTLPPLSLTVPTDVAIGAMSGQKVKDIPQTIAANAMDNKPLLGGLLTGGGIIHKVPGQEGTDGLMLRTDSGAIKAIMDALGAAGTVAHMLGSNYGDRSKLGSDWAQAGVWQDYKQEWKDNTQFMNSVWRNNLPQSTFGSLEERTNQMWRNVAAAANVKSDIRGEGFTGTKRGTPLVTTGESPVPNDPQMRNLYMSMAEMGKNITREIMPKENLIRSQMDNLKTTPFMPDEARRIQNKLSGELYQLTAQKHKMLLDLNAQLSQIAGGRHVDVGQGIDWQGKIEQFHH